MKISIIGAGIAGLSAAIAFKKAKIDFEIFEANAQVRAGGAGLGLAPNAIKGLDKLGISQQVLEHGIQLPYFNILNQQGKVLSHNNSIKIQQLYGLDNFAIHRQDLHACLLQEIGMDRIITGRKVISVNNEENGVKLICSDGSMAISDYVVVADGVYSSIRISLVPGSLPRYAGYTCWRGIADGKDIFLEGASETWGKAGRIGLVPLSRNQIYWFACVNAKAGDAHMKSMDIKGLVENFTGYHHPIQKVISQTPSEGLLHNDLYDIEPLEQYAFEKILLIGDAAHATTPNLGQGACQAIEDAAVLLDELQKDNVNLQSVFKAVERRRIKKASMVIKQSRRVGLVAQLSNPLMIGLRNFAISATPDSTRYAQLASIYNVDYLK